MSTNSASLCVLHVPHAYAPIHGGAEVLIQNVSEQLVCKGHKVSVLTTNVGEVPGLYAFGVHRLQAGRETLGGVEVTRLDYGGWLYSLGTLLDHLPWERGRIVSTGRLMQCIRTRLTVRMEQEMRRMQPDVVVVTPQLLPPVVSLLGAQRRYPLPLVMIPLIHRGWEDRVVEQLRVALQQADAVVAMTEMEARDLVSVYGVPEDRVFTVGMGVSIPPVVGRNQHQPRVTYLGRKVAAKGLDVLIEAMKTVWKSLPDTELVLAGARGRWTAPIDEMVAALPAWQRGRVQSVDNIGEREKLDILAQTTCLVLPSLSESFGIVLLEAMASAVPVIVPDIPVYRQVVAPGKEGLLVAPQDPLSLASAIRQLLESPMLARSMGEAGRLKAIREHSWPDVADRYLESYRHAVAVFGGRTAGRGGQYGGLLQEVVGTKS